MPLIAWNDNLSVGIVEIDTQHQKLVSILNDLHAAMSQGKGALMAPAILKNLVEYTQVHFSTEERLMSQYGYPELASHRKQHQELTQKVLEFQAQYQAGQATLTLQLMTFLRDWLVNHILGTDKQYAPFFHQKGLQ